jgi:hypothetical protein
VKQGVIYFSDLERDQDGIEAGPELCTICAKPIREKPFFVAICWDEREIEFTHVECGRESQRHMRIGLPMEGES